MGGFFFMTTDKVMPYPMPGPMPPAAKPLKKLFTWSDVSTLIGFISSIVGIVWCAILMLPLGATCSILGFKGNKNKGLAVAGIVISVIAGLIKVGIILYEAGLLPQWFISGIS
jgi:hypothetical protein